jgi:hypothetical protein
MIFDRATITGRVKTPEGYLRVTARIARTGVQEYRGLKDADGKVQALTRVWRPEEEVFKPESMASFSMKPVTNDHPPVTVDSTNAEKYSVGTSGESVTRDGDHLVTTLLVTNAKAIKAIEDGKEEISNGYLADLEWKSGTTPQGEAYDAIQRNIRGNHIAIVDAGRCGGSCRISDSVKASCSCGGHEVTDIILKTITIDGVPVKVNDDAEIVIAKLQRDLSKAVTDLATSQTALGTATTDHKAALTAKQAEIDVLMAAQTEDALDARVADRVSVITKAKGVFGDSYEPKGKSNAVIRKETVTKVLGDEKVAGKDDSYFTVAFDIIDGKPAKSPTDPVREALKERKTPLNDGESNAFADYCESLRTAHLTVDPKEVE